MKRLTNKDKSGYYLTGDGIYSDWGVPEKFRGEDIDRLAAIEDILGNEYDLDHLRELAQADREGRCVVLPCKVGDTLYRIQRFRRGKNWRKEAEFIRTVELNKNNLWRIVMDGEIGKTVFLTRAEAEAALRREQE